MANAKYRSEPRDYAAGAPFTFPTAFLDPARKMSAPVIEKMLLRFRGKVTPNNISGSGGMPAAMLALLWDKVLLQDQAGDRVNLDGFSLLCVNQHENGIAGENYGPDLASGSSVDAAIDLEIPLTPHKARRRNDFGLPLNEFLDGGKLQFNVATDGTLNSAVASIESGSFDVIAFVREERDLEAKSRVCWVDYVVGQTEYTYPINGSLRHFLHRVDAEDWVDGNILDNAVGSGEIEVTSRTVDYSQLPESTLKKEYELESDALYPSGLAQAGGDRIEDLISSGFVMPIITQRSDDKIGGMYDMTGMHYKYVSTGGTTAVTGKIVTSMVTDRQPALMARTLKAPSLDMLATALGKYGKVHSARTGADSGIGEWNPKIVARLPVTYRK
jgi:hypothetical protein